MKQRKHKYLAPKDASRLFLSDPDAIGVTLPDLLKAFDLTFADLLPDLQSGKLIADTSAGKTLRQAIASNDVTFSGFSIVMWLAERPDLMAKEAKRGLH